MKFYLHRIATQLVESDVLTYLLPYEARFGSRSARHS